jgi:hypothetical protein
MLAGIVLVPVFIYILLSSNNKRVMQATNGSFQNFWLSFAAGGMVLSKLFVTVESPLGIIRSWNALFSPPISSSKVL